MVAAALNSPEVRLPKIRKLKEQIDAEVYRISAEQVAASVLEQVRENREPRAGRGSRRLSIP